MNQTNRPESTRPEPHRHGPQKIFYEEFESHLNMDDYFQFFSNRKKADNHTFLYSDIYTAEKMATIILEEYSVRGKLAGHVIVAFPEPDTNVPVFTFQLGGNAKRSIALLDISPTLPDIDYTPLLPVFEKYRKLLDMEPSRLDWVNSICSPYLLHAQYEELDTDLFQKALREYLRIWIEHYYKPGIKLTDKQAVENATNAITKYKRVLHDNDPAYGIFRKEWGAPMADAFFHIETRDHPSIQLLDHSRQKEKAWENKSLNIIWERRAQERVSQAPEQVQQRIIDAIEVQAAEDNMGIITLELFDKYKDSMLSSIGAG
jgi:hypothetical protein